MTNKYLEKIASNNHMGKALVSPAWQENAIAKDHGQKGPKGAWNNIKSHFGGSLRASGRSLVEGAAGAGVGAALGSGVGALLTKGRNVAPGASIGGVVGSYAGILHGRYASLHNQGKEHNKKYSDMSKKAALDSLIEAGLDFESAVALISTLS